MIEKWNIITHLVHCSLTNIDDVKWALVFYRYTNESRTMLRGGHIAMLDANGKIVVVDPAKHKIVFTELNDEKHRFCFGNGAIIFLEKEVIK